MQKYRMARCLPDSEADARNQKAVPLLTSNHRLGTHLQLQMALPLRLWLRRALLAPLLLAVAVAVLPP